MFVPPNAECPSLNKDVFILAEVSRPFQHENTYVSASATAKRQTFPFNDSIGVSPRVRDPKAMINVKRNNIPLTRRAAASQSSFLIDWESTGRRNVALNAALSVSIWVTACSGRSALFILARTPDPPTGAVCKVADDVSVLSLTTETWLRVFRGFSDLERLGNFLSLQQRSPPPRILLYCAVAPPNTLCWSITEG